MYVFDDCLDLSKSSYEPRFSQQYKKELLQAVLLHQRTVRKSNGRKLKQFKVYASLDSS